MPKPISFIILLCERCGYEWYPQRPQLPAVCPRCKSYKWQEPRKRPEAQK